jgi:hypothetical protein
MRPWGRFAVIVEITDLTCVGGAWPEDEKRDPHADQVSVTGNVKNNFPVMGSGYAPLGCTVVSSASPPEKFEAVNQGNNDTFMAPSIGE